MRKRTIFSESPAATARRSSYRRYCRIERTAARPRHSGMRPLGRRPGIHNHDRVHGFSDVQFHIPARPSPPPALTSERLIALTNLRLTPPPTPPPPPPHPPP